jgi:hypothetical protein
MTTVVLDDETADLVSRNLDVELRDRRGRLLGVVAHGVSAEDVRISLERLRSDQPRYTTKEVLERLQQLGEEESR